MRKIDLIEIVKGKKTYPNWTTGSVYTLKTKDLGNEILVFYHTKSNRMVSRTFPAEIDLNYRFSYIFGFLKGEGSTSQSKANYRRFTITNSEPKIMKMVLMELENSNLLKRSSLRANSLHLVHHTKLDEDVIEYWSKELDLPKERFKCFKSHPGRNPYGVCHIFISDVLLRRVVDIIHEEIFSKNKLKEE